MVLKLSRDTIRARYFFASHLTEQKSSTEEQKNVLKNVSTVNTDQKSSFEVEYSGSRQGKNIIPEHASTTNRNVHDIRDI